MFGNESLTEITNLDFGACCQQHVPAVQPVCRSSLLRSCSPYLPGRRQRQPHTVHADNRATAMMWPNITDQHKRKICSTISKLSITTYVIFVYGQKLQFSNCRVSVSSDNIFFLYFEYLFKVVNFLYAVGECGVLYVISLYDRFHCVPQK